jgi:alkanesulfonate monooxygenase SsuD/methylene tetrahydromethanopterin reductase-like flavin-dependent oxidoreductase (luciferase family)
MRLGTSLRFIYASTPDSMATYHREVAGRGEFSDIPLGVPDARRQADQLLEIAGTASAAGLDFLMVGDSHASSYANAFAPTPTLARMLAVTGDMPVGLLYLAPFHHPIIAAEQVGTLSAFARGPVTLILGNGDVSSQFAAFGIPKGSRGKRTEEQIQVIRRLLDGETVTHKGPYFSIHSARINPVPKEKTPIWLAAMRGAAVERAARLADGWETAPGTQPEELVELLALYTKVCAEHGRTPNPILRRDIHVGATDESAWADVEPIIKLGYRGFGNESTSSLVGSAATVVERLKYYKELGFDFVLVRHIVGEHQKILESFKRIGDDVLPQIRSI